MCYYSKCSTQFTKKGATGQGERGMYSSISCTYYIVSYRKKQKGCTGVSQVQSTKGKRSSTVSCFYPHFDYLLRRSNTVLFKSDCKFSFENLKYGFVSEIWYSLKNFLGL